MRVNRTTINQMTSWVNVTWCVMDDRFQLCPSPGWISCDSLFISKGINRIHIVSVTTVTMGILGHRDLQPVAEPIALFEQYVSGEPQTLVLREKVFSVSGDSFEIKFANGAPLIKVRGAWMSLSGRKKVEDAQGNHLFDIVKEHLHIHTTYALEDTRHKKMCEVKSSLACTFCLLWCCFTMSIRNDERTLLTCTSARLQGHCHFHW